MAPPNARPDRRQPTFPPPRPTPAARSTPRQKGLDSRSSHRKRRLWALPSSIVGVGRNSQRRRTPRTSCLPLAQPTNGPAALRRPPANGTPVTLERFRRACVLGYLQGSRVAGSVRLWAAFVPKPVGDTRAAVLCASATARGGEIPVASPAWEAQRPACSAVLCCRAGGSVDDRNRTSSRPYAATGPSSA
jgi:hypothetical protein